MIKHMGQTHPKPWGVDPLKNFSIIHILKKSEKIEISLQTVLMTLLE